MGRVQKRIPERNNQVLVVNDKADMGKSYYLPFTFIGPKTEDHSILFENPKSISLIVFTGGADVSPHLYDEPIGRHTYSNTDRDNEEIRIFNQAVKENIPMFGICRGLQFLTVMQNGKLVQHSEGHHQSHKIQTIDKFEFQVTSSHHQMVLPSNHDDIIAWSSPKLSKFYLNGLNQKITTELEVEVVKFNKIKAVGVQYHPEIMNQETYGFFYVEDLIRRYLPSAVS